MAVTRTEFEDIIQRLCEASLNAPLQDHAISAPCSRLVEEYAAQGYRFVEQQTSSPGTNEYRLNGDELKLRYNVESYRDGDQNHVRVVSLRVTGDQVAAYPDFVREAEAILQVKQREETSRSKAA
jgi:hypothetical protein